MQAAQAPPMPALQVLPHFGARAMATKRKAAAIVETEQAALLPKRRGRPKKASVTIQKRSASSDAKPRQEAKQDKPVEQAKAKVSDAIEKKKTQAVEVREAAKEKMTETKQEAKQVAQEVTKEANQVADKAQGGAKQFADAAVDALGKGPAQVKQVLESVQDAAGSKSKTGGNAKHEDYTSGEIPQNQKTGLLVAFGAVAAWFAFGGKLQKSKKGE
ncbi:hypothetical protein BCR37DRAFT_392369 [Protomyces lactucae-debilis]|uniref:Uncharacterized protein n=1 Tax=Protomyces lactucae-debilis TaxID=2754530 RepID=A0A1Y2FHD3_PROLT|nr:uncharacterized protein BCR37DRAFT_392369 [Protomyces lactucae-debilis]ORY83007.1 hypothetical protein BCR37DRAFT_392369 [Protomyces lactucae-debilis]